MVWLGSGVLCTGVLAGAGGLVRRGQELGDSLGHQSGPEGSGRCWEAGEGEAGDQLGGSEPGQRREDPWEVGT